MTIKINAQEYPVIQLHKLIRFIINKRKKPRGYDTAPHTSVHCSLCWGCSVNSTISSQADLTTMKHLLLICLFYTLFEAGLSAEKSPCVQITYTRTNNVGFRCTQLTTLQKYLDQARANTTIITIFDSNISNVPG